MNSCLLERIFLGPSAGTKKHCVSGHLGLVLVGDKVPGVVAVLFSPAEVAGLAVMSLKRLVVYEAT